MNEWEMTDKEIKALQYEMSVPSSSTSFESVPLFMDIKQAAKVAQWKLLKWLFENGFVHNSQFRINKDKWDELNRGFGDWT